MWNQRTASGFHPYHTWGRISVILLLDYIHRGTFAPSFIFEMPWTLFIRNIKFNQITVTKLNAYSLTWKIDWGSWVCIYIYIYNQQYLATWKMNFLIFPSLSKHPIACFMKHSGQEFLVDFFLIISAELMVALSKVVATCGE